MVSDKQRSVFPVVRIVIVCGARERITAYAGHAVRDGHRCQTAAVPERFTAYAGHAVGDGHRCQAAAMFVFATSYYSIFCEL